MTESKQGVAYHIDKALKDKLAIIDLYASHIEDAPYWEGLPDFEGKSLREHISELLKSSEKDAEILETLNSRDKNRDV